MNIFKTITSYLNQFIRKSTPTHPDIPSLKWAERSDWVNVKTMRAIGDGEADDTAAIQAAIDAVVSSVKTVQKGLSAVYIPAGKYRITAPLRVVSDTGGPITGMLLVGCGRDTIIEWAGPAGVPMIQMSGFGYSRIVGLSLDGKGVAQDGINYNSKAFFQTGVIHRYIAVRNVKRFGICDDVTFQQTLAEVTFESCLFENCDVGINIPNFNDYDYTIDRCEIRKCRQGIFCQHGNFYIRNTHFEGNTEFDIWAAQEHGASIRHCSSHGSSRFLFNTSGVATLNVQDCHVDSWTYPDGAIATTGEPGCMWFDLAFSNPPKANGVPVAAISGNNYNRNILIANNSFAGSPSLFGPNFVQDIHEVPNGKLGCVVTSGSQSFLPQTVTLPGKVFDAVHDFGAKGDGYADDTAAIQACINAASKSGNQTIAYLPRGIYRVTQTLRVSGEDYFFGSAGFTSQIVWAGSAGVPIVQVHDCHNVVIENIAVGNGTDNLSMVNSYDIEQIGSSGPTMVTYDNVAVFGRYENMPDKRGLHFVGLGAQEQVLVRLSNGNLRFTDSAQATILVSVSYEGGVTIEGKSPRRGGFLGFQTRFGPCAPHSLSVLNNQSAVFSDFYIEDTVGGFYFQGDADDPPGQVTLQAVKVHQTDTPETYAVTINNYAGKIFFGPGQFYGAPPKARITQSGTAVVDFFVLLCTFYGTAMDLSMGATVNLNYIGNIADGSVTQITEGNIPDAILPTAMADIALAMDDLRRIGEVNKALTTS